LRNAVPAGLFGGLRAHLMGECLGNLHEIFDGDAPHAARGCVAQAWSVAEALRVARGDVGLDI
jgi:glycogen debranching enzyme